MSHTSLNPVDTVWLHTDQSDNVMVIEALVRLDGTLDRGRFVRVVQRRLVERFRVFSQRPVAPLVPGLLPRWRDVPDFDVTDHLVEAVLPAPGDDAALQDYMAGSLGTPLPRDRPLWQIHLVEGRPEGTALFLRLHHALADGIALTRVLVSITDACADAEDDAPSDDAPSDEAPLDGGPDEGARDAPVAPVRLARRAGAVLGGLAQVVPIAGKLLLSRLPDSPLAGEVVDRKRVVWARPISLPRVKQVAEASGATVNDVLVTALAGGLRRYQRHHGAEPVDLATMIPVNLRPLHKPLPARLGNRFSVVLLRLPSGRVGAPERLSETKRRMDRIKASPEPLMTFVLMHLIGAVGPHLGRGLARFFAGKAVGVTTNVPGPREQRYLAGTRVDALLGWVPGTGHQSLGTCIFTYAGQVHVGFKVDAGIVPDPEEVLEGFHAELDALLEHHVEPDGPGPDVAPATARGVVPPPLPAPGEEPLSDETPLVALT